MESIIHIGYPKTATTWFQEQFYPKVKESRYFSREEVKKKIIEPNTFNFNTKIVSDFFSSPERFIICEEMLLGSLYTGWSNGAFTKEMADRLKKCFPESKIVIFIRNQFDIITSAYGQYVKSGGNYGVNNFLYHKKRYFFSHNIFLFSFAYLEYDKIIAYYQNLFGKDNVYVFIYEEFCDNDKLFIKKYCELLDINLDLEHLDYTRINKSYRKYILKLARVFNIFTKRSIFFKYYLVNVPYWFKLSKTLLNYLNRFRLFGKIQTPIQILGRKNYDFIKNYYKESNQNLYNKIGIKLIKKYNYPM